MASQPVATKLHQEARLSRSYVQSAHVFIVPCIGCIHGVTGIILMVNVLEHGGDLVGLPLPPKICCWMHQSTRRPLQASLSD